MLSAQSRGTSVPTSVHFVKEPYDPFPMVLHPERSQPIPIKKCCACARESEDEIADASSHYDWATWNMYSRITTARRLRAISRSGYSVQLERPIMMAQAQDHLAIAHGQVHRPKKVDVPSCAQHTRPLSTAEENSGVFFFEM